MAIVIEDLVTKVRFLLGDPSESIISSDTITSIAEDCISEIGDDDTLFCKVLQCTLMKTLRYLIRKSQVPYSSDGNEIKRRKEKRGNTEIELEYQSTSNDDSSTGWDDMYSDYQEHPEWICEELASINSGKYLVNIGGVRKDQVRNVKRDPISHTAYDRRRINNKFRSRKCRRRVR